MPFDISSLRASRPSLPPIARFLACLVAAMVALPAAADIFKCTDRTGNVTYQNEKCPTGTKAGRVEIFDNNWTANRTEKEAEWLRNAADHRVVTGMPGRWVREALGAPAEIRETTAGGATELWAYSFPDRTVQVGMRDNEVLWSRETPVSVPVAKVAPASQPSPLAAARVPEAPRAADVSRTTESSRVSDLPREGDAPRTASASRPTDSPRGAVRGRNCRDVLAELGTPDRQREIPASDVGGTDAATEYVYEPSGSNATRTRILCANGKVEGVDRSVAR